MRWYNKIKIEQDQTTDEYQSNRESLSMAPFSNRRLMNWELFLKRNMNGGRASHLVVALIGRGKSYFYQFEGNWKDFHIEKFIRLLLDF